MIGVIGREEDAMGFGLAGVDRIRTLDKDAKPEEVLEAIQSLGDVRAVVIAEHLHDKIRDHRSIRDLLMIDIPERGDPTEDRIARLTKELLGVDI